MKLHQTLIHNRLFQVHFFSNQNGGGQLAASTVVHSVFSPHFFNLNAGAFHTTGAEMKSICSSSQLMLSPIGTNPQGGTSSVTVVDTCNIQIY